MVLLVMFYIIITYGALFFALMAGIKAAAILIDIAEAAITRKKGGSRK